MLRGWMDGFKSVHGWLDLGGEALKSTEVG